MKSTPRFVRDGTPPVLVSSTTQFMSQPRNGSPPWAAPSTSLPSIPPLRTLVSTTPDASGSSLTRTSTTQSLPHLSLASSDPATAAPPSSARRLSSTPPTRSAPTSPSSSTEIFFFIHQNRY